MRKARSWAPAPPESSPSRGGSRSRCSSRPAGFGLDPCRRPSRGLLRAPSGLLCPGPPVGASSWLRTWPDRLRTTALSARGRLRSTLQRHTLLCELVVPKRSVAYAPRPRRWPRSIGHTQVARTLVTCWCCTGGPTFARSAPCRARRWTDSGFGPIQSRPAFLGPVHRPPRRGRHRLPGRAGQAGLRAGAAQARGTTRERGPRARGRRILAP